MPTRIRTAALAGAAALALLPLAAAQQAAQSQDELKELADAIGKISQTYSYNSGAPIPGVPVVDEAGFAFTGNAVTLSHLGRAEVAAAAFGPNKTVAAVGRAAGGTGFLKIWDGAGKELASVREDGRLTCVAFSADGKRLVVGHGDGRLTLHDPASGKRIENFGRHSSAVKSLAFSADGKMLASGARDTTIRLWDAETWQARHVLHGHFGAVTALAFTRDGKTLVGRSYSGDTLVWDPAAGKQRPTKTPINIPAGASAFALAPDGKTLATVSVSSMGVGFVSLETGKPLGGMGQPDASGNPPQIPEDDDPFTSRLRYNTYANAAYSPDGKSLATVTNGGEIVLWDVKDKKITATLKQSRELGIYAQPFMAVQQPAAPTAWSPELRWSADGKRIATARQGNAVNIFDVATKKLVHTLSGPTPTAAAGDATLRALAYAPDGARIAAALEDGTISLRDRKTGEEKARLRGHDGPATALAWARDGRTLVSGGIDRTVKVWDLPAAKERFTLRGHTKWVHAVAVSPDGGLIASGGYDRQVKLWNAADGKEVASMSGHTAAIRSLAFAPDGKRLASGGMDRSVRLWDVAARKSEAPLEGEQAGVRGVAFSRDGRTLVAVSESNVATSWDVSASPAKRLANTKTGAAELHAVAASPSGAGFVLAGRNAGAPSDRYGVSVGPGGPVLSGGNSAAFVWRPGQGEARALSTAIGSEADTVAFAPDGLQFATGGDGPMVLHNASAVPVRMFEGQKARAHTVAFSPDGKLVLTACGDAKLDNAVILRDRASGKEVRRIDGGKALITAAAFSADGKRVVSGHDDGVLKLWDAATGKPLRSVVGERKAIRKIVAAPQGGLMAAAAGGMVLLIYGDTGGRQANFEPLVGEIRALAFSPDGTRLLIGGASGKAVIREGGRWMQSREIVCGEPVADVAWVKDGAQILAAAGRRLLVCDAGTGKVVRTMAGQGGNIDRLILTPDGTTAATTGQDAQLLLWDVPTGTELVRFNPDFVPAPFTGPKIPPQMPIPTPPPPVDEPAPSEKVEAKEAPAKQDDPKEPPKEKASAPQPPPAVLQPPPPPGGMPTVPSTPGVIALAVSADGRYLITAGGPLPQQTPGAPAGYGVRVWDLRMLRMLPPAAGGGADFDGYRVETFDQEGTFVTP